MELTPRQRSARRRVARELARDPDHYRKLGKKGGRRRVPKGLAVLPPETRSAIGKAGAKARHQNT